MSIQNDVLTAGPDVTATSMFQSMSGGVIAVAQLGTNIAYGGNAWAQMFRADGESKCRVKILNLSVDEAEAEFDLEDKIEMLELRRIKRRARNKATIAKMQAKEAAAASRTTARAKRTTANK